MNFKNTALAILLSGLIGAACILTAQASRSTRDGVYTPEQALRGKQVYVDYCTKCHGRALLGEGDTRPVAGDRFLNAWESNTVLALFDRVHITMPFINPGQLNRQQTADVVAFILYFNGYPAGATELSTKAEILQGIQIDLPKH